MRTVLLILPLAISLVSLATQRGAEACSPINDVSETPSSELDFDPAESPATPIVIDAELYQGDSIGCGGGGDCGGLHGLRLTLEVDPATTRVRIDFTDRAPVYAHVQNVHNGIANIHLMGYEDVEVIEMTIRAMDSNGYKSQPVDTKATSDHGHGGCNSSGSQSAGLLLFTSLFVVVRRRKRV